jgi:hypothetical protein
LQLEAEGYLKRTSRDKVVKYVDTGKTAYHAPRPMCPSDRRSVIDIVWQIVENAAKTIDFVIYLTPEGVERLRSLFRAENELISDTLAKYDIGESKAADCETTSRDCMPNYGAACCFGFDTNESTLTHARRCAENYLLSDSNHFLYFTRYHFTPSTTTAFRRQGIKKMIGELETMAAELSEPNAPDAMRYKLSVSLGEIQPIQVCSLASGVASRALKLLLVAFVLLLPFLLKSASPLSCETHHVMATDECEMARTIDKVDRSGRRSWLPAFFDLVLKGDRGGLRDEFGSIVDIADNTIKQPTQVA